LKNPATLEKPATQRPFGFKTCFSPIVKVRSHNEKEITWIHEKQIISMSVLSPTRHLTIKITQYDLPPQPDFNCNQTVIHSEKVALAAESHCLIGIGFHSNIPNGRPAAEFAKRREVHKISLDVSG
jgi:hypothetical protein